MSNYKDLFSGILSPEAQAIDARLGEKMRRDAIKVIKNNGEYEYEKDGLHVSFLASFEDHSFDHAFGTRTIKRWELDCIVEVKVWVEAISDWVIVRELENDERICELIRAHIENWDESGQ